MNLGLLSKIFFFAFIIGSTGLAEAGEQELDQLDGLERLAEAGEQELDQLDKLDQSDELDGLESITRMRSEDPNNETDVAADVTTDVAADVTTDVAADVTDVASAIRNAVDSMAEDPRNAEDSSYRCYDVTKDKHSRWTQRLGRCQRSCDYNEPGCFGKEGYCEVDMGECLLPSYSTTDPTLLLSNPNICKNALLLPCGVYSGKHIVGGNGDPCPLKFKGYYCNFEKQTSYGCGVGLRSVCWKSYTSYGTVGWCVVAAAGACTYDTRCRVATWLPCEG